MNSFPQRLFSRIIGLCFILALTSAHAQVGRIGPTSTNPTSAEVQRIDISGTVVNSVTGEAIARALVTLGGGEVHSMLTDSDGRFAFEKVPAQNMYLQARRPGFFDRPQVFVSAEAGKTVVVKMTPAGLIFGQVVDDNGEPIESAQVRLLQQRLVVGKRRWAGLSSAQTNDQGRYRLPNLHPGRYIIAVLAEANRGLGAGKTGYASVYYPKAPDAASATPIQISAGEQSEADFELSPSAVYRISGIVTGPKTQGSGITLKDASGIEAALFARVEPTTGEFEVRGVPKGTYTVRAQGSTEQGGLLSAVTTVTVNNDLSGIVLMLHAPIEIPVVVRSESSQAGAADPNRMPGLNFQAISTTDEQSSGYATFEGSPQNGRYVLHLADSGSYNVMISSYGAGYVRSATCGSTDLLTEPLVVPSSGSVSPVEVVLASDGATVTGKVRGAGGPGMVVAVPDDEAHQPTVSGYGYPGREFRFPSLAPGDYMLYAIRPSEDIDYSDRDALKPFRSKAVHVTLAPNQTTQVTLDLIETEQ